MVFGYQNVQLMKNEYLKKSCWWVLSFSVERCRQFSGVWPWRGPLGGLRIAFGWVEVLQPAGPQ